MLIINEEQENGDHLRTRQVRCLTDAHHILNGNTKDCGILDIKDEFDDVAPPHDFLGVFLQTFLGLAELCLVFGLARLQFYGAHHF